MADTKEGREKQAADADQSQRERALREELERRDEEPPTPDPDEPQVCHYRNCTELATFHVRERYEEETGHGLVTAEALVCTAHAEGEHPTNLDNASPDYVFSVEPLPGAFESEES
jgi:hypothetical protein